MQEYDKHASSGALQEKVFADIGMGSEATPEPDTPEVELAEAEVEVEIPSFAGDDAAYVGDPEMAAMAAEAGIEVDPAIIAATQQPDPATAGPDYTSQRQFQPS